MFKRKSVKLRSVSYME